MDPDKTPAPSRREALEAAVGHRLGGSSLGDTGEQMIPGVTTGGAARPQTSDPVLARQADADAHGQAEQAMTPSVADREPAPDGPDDNGIPGLEDFPLEAPL